MARVAVKMNRYEDEKWAKHYSSNHEILLVGEGDFSFAVSLAFTFGSASNIVATSLDTHDDVVKKYKRAEANLKFLASLGAQLLHGVDATTMKFHTHLQVQKFDRIVYNFPHAGFLRKEVDRWVIMSHKNLVRGFFENASGMLRASGEVHVTHKTTSPYSCWNIVELGAQSGLALLERVDFNCRDYPGYQNKRGDGWRSDQPFPLGKCGTFKFILSLTTTSHHGINHQQPAEILLLRPNAMIPGINHQLAEIPLPTPNAMISGINHQQPAEIPFPTPDSMIPASGGWHLWPMVAMATATMFYLIVRASPTDSPKWGKRRIWEFFYKMGKGSTEKTFSPKFEEWS